LLFERNLAKDYENTAKNPTVGYTIENTSEDRKTTLNPFYLKEIAVKTHKDTAKVQQ